MRGYGAVDTPIFSKTQKGVWLEVELTRPLLLNNEKERGFGRSRHGHF